MYDPGGPVERFVAHLEKLANDDRRGRAAMAALRRGLGRTPGTAIEMSPYVVPFTGHLRPEQEDAYYLVASLFAFHYRKDRPEWPASIGRRSFGASYAWLAQEEARARDEAEPSTSLERRFVALLACRREDLPDHLRHAVSLLRAYDVLVDWAMLLRDVTRWDLEGHPVQRQWARDFWRAPEISAQVGSTAMEE